MKIIRFVNSIFTSNSYLICFEESDSVFVVDPGDSIPILDWLKNNHKSLKGILITHSHFDHIYGINDLYGHFPMIQIYASENAKEGMLSAKLNRSYYTENPFVVNCININIVAEADTILLTQSHYANVIYTPGHNNDCLSFEIENNVFTGDSFIPGIKVHTKSKNSDKKQAEDSIKRIIEQFDDDTMIWPGHEENCLLGEMSKISLKAYK